MSSIETMNGRTTMDLKRGIDETKSANKKPRLEKEKKGNLLKQEDFELEEKVASDCKAKLEHHGGNTFISMKEEEMSETLRLHTGSRWAESTALNLKYTGCFL